MAEPDPPGFSPEIEVDHMAVRKFKRSEQRFDANTYPYLKCREQHEWEFYDGTILENEGEVHIVMKCANCTTKRPRVLSLRVSTPGKLQASNYKYPKDYHVQGGLTAHERGEVRLHNALALLAEHGITRKKKRG